MQNTSNRWQVAIRVFISAVLLALSVFLSSNFVSAQADSQPIPEPGTTYVVQANDTLARIAAYAYDDGTLYAALCEYNQLDNCHRIVPGTELVIPLLEDLNLPPPTPAPTSTTAPETTPEDAEPTPASTPTSATPETASEDAEPTPASTPTPATPETASEDAEPTPASTPTPATSETASEDAEPTPTLTPAPASTPTPAAPDTTSGDTEPTLTSTPAAGPELDAVPPELVDTLYLVQTGDTLASIATASYNNESLAGRLCVFNMIPDCTVLEPGWRIFVPEMDILLFGEPQTYLPAVVASADTTPPDSEAAPALPADDAATPDADTEADPDSPAPTPAATPSPVVPSPERSPTPVVPTPQVPANLNMADYIDQDPRLEIYAYALTLSTLGDLLTQTGPYTLLAPSDSAWVQAETSVIQDLLVSSTVLTQVLRAHIVEGNLSYEDLAARDSITSISGVVWSIATAPNGDLLVGGARISGSSSSPTNGTIHILSTLIYP